MTRRRPHVGFLVALAACGPRAPQTGSGDAPASSQTAAVVPLESAVVVALVEHIVAAKRKVTISRTMDETVWTDFGVLERTGALPNALADHLTRYGQDTPTREEMLGLLAHLESSVPEHRPAQVRRKSAEDAQCIVVDEDTRAVVDCAYLDYAAVRYPTARVLLRGPAEPVLIVEKGFLRLVIMPMRPVQRR